MKQKTFLRVRGKQIFANFSTLQSHVICCMFFIPQEQLHHYQLDPWRALK